MMGSLVAVGEVQPPLGNTGASVTTEEVQRGVEVGVHWLAGRSLVPSVAVLSAVSEIVGAGVQEMPRGNLGYRTQYRVGPVVVLMDGTGPQAESMGSHIEVTGSGCEELGYAKLRELWHVVQLRVSRVDLAVDGCPFTPEQVWAAWTAGDVRTKVKLAKDAKEGREWRSGEWIQSASGDTAMLGGKQAARRLRVYDRRETGTRLELQVRHGAADVVAAAVFSSPDEAVGPEVLSHVRSFVDFLEGEGENVTRRPLASWWSEFVGGVEKSRVRLTGVVVGTFVEAVEWIQTQVAPLLAVIRERLTETAFLEILDGGKKRWKKHHRRLLFEGERTVTVERQTGARGLPAPAAC